MALEGPGVARPRRTAGSTSAGPWAAETARISHARRIWHVAQPIRSGDAVDHYLRHPLAGWQPSSGWLPTLRHGRWQHGPALVAAACPWPGWRVTAVQLTRLTEDGRKAAVTPTRLTVGLLRGAVVRLGPWVPGRPLVLVEGIVDGLAVLAATAAGATPPVIWVPLKPPTPRPSRYPRRPR